MKSSMVLASQGGDSAQIVQEASLADNDDEFDNRGYRLKIPPRKDCERAIIRPSRTANQIENDIAKKEDVEDEDDRSG